MKRTALIWLLFFIAGFLTHAFFFPDVLSNGLTDVSNIIIPNASPTNTTSANNEPLITKIAFNGTRFTKHAVTIGFTRYIQIVNTSKTERMNLVSNMKELTTPRAYAESEAVQTQCNTKGTFVVEDSKNPAEKLVITVK